MPDVTFTNKLPFDIRIDWKNEDGAPVAQAHIPPQSSYTFNEKRRTHTEYGVYLKRDNFWVKFDQDWVSVWKSRLGAVNQTSHSVVDWGSVIGKYACKASVKVIQVVNSLKN